ncbi:TonB-dependent receptor [Sphingomonas hylomeconis]|uniref:TonB-dependent receptor n=1 Tax=Sphingomonas hylomeconis TaxID=1395958 RepID=A0ABV7T3F7_9SPHN|nr:TonB-dependent receptor [Sphingomonas hylomeconis]
MKSIFLATAGLAALVATTAHAQTAANAPDAQENGQATGPLDPSVSDQNDSDRHDDIVVTATRRPERLRDIPLSVTAFSQKELTAKGIVGYEGLARETPGIVLNKPSANFNNFTARGIATNGYGAGLQSTVAVYIDELPISTIGNTTVLDTNLYDVERVEFLRGPQGTLFGSGSLSGALRILTKAPDLTKFGASGLVDLGLTGSDSFRQRYNGMINVPIIDDKVGLRVVGFYRDEEGYLDNVGTGVHNSNTLIDWGGRATLLIKPTERLSIKFLGSYEDSNPKDSSLTSPSLGREKRISDQPDLYTGKLATGNMTLDYQFDGAHLTSSTTYSSFDQKFYVDLANTFGGALPFGLDADGAMKTFVEEARLSSDPGGKIDWVVGGFYLGRRLDVDFNYRTSPALLSAIYGANAGLGQYYQRLNSHTISHELAGFGELTYRFDEKFWVTGGLRYGRVDSQAFTEAGGYLANFFAVAFQNPAAPVAPRVDPYPYSAGLKVSASRATYKISASFKPSASLTTYATLSTGFRTPVVNALAGRASVINAADIIIPDGASSDNLKNYEIGMKGRFLDGKLTANLAVYLIDWKNIQVQANRTSDAVQFATNIGGARSKGIELELLAYPVSGLTIGVNGSLNDAKVTKLSASEAAISGATLGARLSAPHFQGSTYINYAFAVSPSALANIALSAQHVGSFPSEFPRVPGNPAATKPTFGYTDSYENVNATVGVQLDRLSLAAYVENIFDDHSVTYRHPEAFLASRVGTLRPRTIGLRVGYDF